MSADADKAVPEIDGNHGNRKEIATDADLISAFLKSHTINKKGERLQIGKVLRNKLGLLYFCESTDDGNCDYTKNIFKPFYESLQKKPPGDDCKIPFEVIVVPAGSNKDDLLNDFVENHGDYMTMSYKSKILQHLLAHYQVVDIPCIRIVNEHGVVVPTDAAKASLDSCPDTSQVGCGDLCNTQTEWPQIQIQLAKLLQQSLLATEMRQLMIQVEQELQESEEEEEDEEDEEEEEAQKEDKKEKKVDDIAAMPENKVLEI